METTTTEITMETDASVRVRPMARGDLPAVTALCTQLGYPETEEAITHRFELLLASPHDTLLVAQDGEERVVGWIHLAGRVLLEAEPFAQVAGIVVDERVRGKSVGRALMAAAEAWADERGYDEVRLWSNIVRERAHRFYEGLGYEHVKTSKVFRKTV
ncbi:MAG TPA: GNAT family N-acetyltransferase [Ktedonobacterales bacterium]|nr:GNAT family N-acetyltransferase [Ktedonobacterales bacterium]